MNPIMTIQSNEKKRLMKLLMEDLTECCDFDSYDCFILQEIYQAIDEFGAHHA